MINVVLTDIFICCVVRPYDSFDFGGDSPRNKFGGLDSEVLQLYCVLSYPPMDFHLWCHVGALIRETPVLQHNCLSRIVNVPTSGRTVHSALLLL